MYCSRVEPIFIHPCPYEGDGVVGVPRFADPELVWKANGISICGSIRWSDAQGDTHFQKVEKGKLNGQESDSIVQPTIRDPCTPGDITQTNGVADLLIKLSYLVCVNTTGTPSDRYMYSVRQ